MYILRYPLPGIDEIEEEEEDSDDDESSKDPFKISEEESAKSSQNAFEFDGSSGQIDMGSQISDSFDQQCIDDLMGEENSDEIIKKKGKIKFKSNNAGGILGGISTGQDIITKIAFEPTSSIRIPSKTINCNKEEKEIITTGRHDPCVGLRAVPIVEAMLALVLIDHALRHRA